MIVTKGGTVRFTVVLRSREDGKNRKGKRVLGLLVLLRGVVCVCG